MVQEARALGFRALEIDYRVTAKQLKAMGPFLARGEMAVASVHHPLPRDPRISPFEAHEDRPSLASLDRDERRHAVRLAAETLSRAADLGAGAAVFHLGTVVLDADVDPRELNRLINAGERESSQYEEHRQKVSASRRSRAPRHLDALLSSLDRVASDALKHKVVVGIENRYHPEQLPDQGELERIFRTFEGAPLGYWHDTGHAASRVALGFLGSQTELLEVFRGRTAGFHLHDAKGLDDHRAPGEGDLDFTVLAPFVVPGTRLVLEVHPPSPPDAVARAVSVLAEAGVYDHGIAQEFGPLPAPD
jgi:sugar phosphate isomerase/epimerase